MKILHINSYDSKGGAETVFKLTINNLDGFENYTACVQLDSDSEKPDIFFKSWEQDNKLIGIFNYIFSLHNYRLLTDFLSSHDIDLIHLHGFFASISPSVLLAINRYKRKNNVKVIQTSHDYHIVCPNASLYNYSKNEICEKCIGKKFKLNIIWNNCDRRGWIYSTIKGIRSFVASQILNHREIVDIFIAPSEFMRTMLVKDGIPIEKIRLIRNPILLNSSAIKRDYEKKDIICYFGRFSKEKDLCFLIEAFAEWKRRSLNDFNLLIIGDGEERDYLIKLSAHKQCSNNIIFKEFMPFSNLMEEIKSAKYFSMSSTCFENTPTSIAQAASMDIIPFVPDLPGMAESINNILAAGKTYIPQNIESWISTITELEKDYSNQLELLHLSIKRIKNFDVGSYIKQISALYHSVINQQ